MTLKFFEKKGKTGVKASKNKTVVAFAKPVVNHGSCAKNKPWGMNFFSSIIILCHIFKV